MKIGNKKRKLIGAQIVNLIWIFFYLINTNEDYTAPIIWIYLISLFAIFIAISEIDE